jgi:drug/metabolite transporter (DMT)-like permease
MTTNPVLIGFACAIAATVLWSGNFIVARGLSDAIAPLSLAFWRWVVAILVLFPFAIKPLLAQKSWLKENLGYLSIVSLLGVTLFNSLIYYAGQTSSAINLSLIAITFPVFILLLSRIFLAETIDWNKLVGIVLVAAGILLLISKGEVSVLTELTFFQGDIWMLMASLIFAIYSMLLKRKPSGISVPAFQLASFALGLVFLLPFYLLELYFGAVHSFASSAALSILYIGIFASLLAFILWNKAIASIGAVNASMVYYSLPIFSGVLAILILDEVVTSLHLYSTLLVLLGIVIAVFYSPKKVRPS